MSVSFAALSLPEIRTKDGAWSYQVTPADLLALARSIRREEPSAADKIAWTYAQRFVTFHGSHFPTLASLIYAFSQPVNPAWFPDGPHCSPGGDYYGTPSCAGAAARPGNASIPWEQIESRTQDAVASWAAGLVDNPVMGATNFAEAGLVARKIAAGNPEGWVYVSQGIPWKKQSYVSTPKSRAWPDNYVQLAVNGKVVGSSSSPLPYVLGALAIGAGAAVWLARKR